MTTEQETTLLIRGAISQLSDEDSQRFKDAYAEIKAIEKRYGDGAIMAIALRGAKLAE